MKNLKKLSVVLFATLLSFNFTSCIDDGVSDAVDQVYLAQAQFLLAQAALQEAEAQFALAAAAHEQAEAALTLAYAEVQLAVARELDANTAWHLAEIDRFAAETEFMAQQNVMTLAKWQAEMDVYLQEQMTLLLAAQSAHEVAMVNLGEAVAQAKDILIFNYYMDYDVVVTALQDLYEEKIMAEHDLALKELMLVGLADGNPATTVDQVSMAYYQAKLETELANLIADLEAEQAWLATLQAITAEDASDYQKAVSAIDEEIAALQVEWDALVIEKAEKFNARDQAFEAWQASMAHYQELVDAINLHAAAVAAKKVHTDMIADTEDAVAEAEANIAAKPALLAAIEAVDTATAYQAILDQIALIGQEDDGDAGENDWDDGWPTADGYFLDNWGGPFSSAGSDGGDFEALSTGTTLYDLWWNAAVVEENAEDALECAQLMMQVGVFFPGARGIQSLEFVYAARVAALAAYVPGTPIVDLEADLAAALLEEEAAQAAYLADPDGFLVEDGDASPYDLDLDNIGTAQAPTNTWMKVASWVETAPASGMWIPATFFPTQYDDAARDLDQLAIIAALGDPTGLGFWAVDAQDDFWYWEQNGDLTQNTGATVGGITDLSVASVASTTSYPTQEDISAVVYVEVGSDDIWTSNFFRLQNARIAATTAQFLLDLELSGAAAFQTAVDASLANLTAGYACLGYDIDVDINGTLGAADFDTVNDYISMLSDALDDANDLENDAQDALADGIALLGVDFRPADDGLSWTNLWDQWWALLPMNDLVSTYGVFGPGVGRYQQLEIQVGPTTWVRDYTVPHTSNVTMYEALRNAYFQRVWAIEAYEACLEVTYDSYNDNDPVNYGWTASNEDVIEQGALDIAALQALMPTHDYAIEYLLGEVERLMDLFDFDFTLWDFEVDHGLAMLGDLELYAAYLDCMNAYDWILHQFDIIDGQIDDLEFLRGAYTWLQPGTGFGSAETVSGFMGMISTAIGTSMTDIGNLEDDIEIQTQLVAHGIIDIDTAQAWIAECQRQLDLLNVEIEGFEAAAASLLARINALLAG